MFIGNESIDLKLCLMDSAQCFSWLATERGYVNLIDGRPVRLWQDADGVWAEGGVGPAAMRHYLDLDRDYGALAREYAHIPVAQRAIALYPGLRVLNENAWEALNWSILSANNNAARIRALVLGLSRALGAPCDFEGVRLYGYPSAERLAACSEAELRALGVGYRAPYLIGSARRVCEGFALDELHELPYEAAHARLVELPGVGDKVADCTLLFGCGQSSAFPVDVWVDKLMRGWFGVNCGRKGMQRAAREMLGAHAGLMQQFLFHAARMGTIEL